MRLGTETGSVMNHIYASCSEMHATKVGEGATILCWSDRQAGTIVKITKTQIHVQLDNATRIDANGMSEQQAYFYSPNTNAPVIVFRKTKRGWRNTSGNGLLIGVRRQYHDFSF